MNTDVKAKARAKAKAKAKARAKDETQRARRKSGGHGESWDCQPGRRRAIAVGLLRRSFSCGGLIAEEEAIVDYAGEDAAEEGADPIDAVVRPVMRGERGAEGAGRVHGAACEGGGEEHIHGDGEADGEAGDFVEGALGIDGGGEENEDKEESGGGFERHAVHAREIGGEFGSAETHGAPNGVGDDGDEKIGGGGGAEELRDPVEEGLQGGQAFGDPEADGDGGVQMAARNVGDGGDHDAEGEAVSGGDGEEADAGLAGGAEVLVSADGADTDENQSEGADEFRAELLRQAVQGPPPRERWRERAGRRCAVVERARFYWNRGRQSKKGARGPRVARWKLLRVAGAAALLTSGAS